MTRVLHIQTRVYPLHYGGCRFVTDRVEVPGVGAYRMWTGELGSQAYNHDRTVEADLTDLVRTVVTLPGVEIQACRARFLHPGTVLLVYALRHDVAVRDLDTHALAALDAEVNDALRVADAVVVGTALDAAVTAGVLRDLVIRPGGVDELWPSEVERHAVRYNCHLITRRPRWRTDPRVPKDVVTGPRCRILLPYTYVWDADPSTPLTEILTMLEPADLAVAQLSVLFSAMVGGRRILADLAQAAVGPVRTHDFRRFLDRIWSQYHQLDFYRMESGQSHRATYLAARATIGLDQARERAADLLDYVASSLVAETSLRSQYLDARLNRVAAALTVVVAAAFAVDIAAFLMPDVDVRLKLAVVTGVLALSAGSLVTTVLSVRGWRRRGDRRSPRARWGRRLLPRPRSGPAVPPAPMVPPASTRPS